MRPRQTAVDTLTSSTGSEVGNLATPFFSFTQHFTYKLAAES